MKVSVLITTYNLEHYVAETIESVLSQKTNFDFEILVGDDGSQDKTASIVKAYAERYPGRIELYVMDRNPEVKYNRIERASKNRINLVEHARGEYLIFLDGDDLYIDEDKLQKQVDILDAEENQDCIACTHNIWLYWNEDEKELINPYKKKFKISGREYWKNCMYFHSDTVMFRNIYHGKFPEEIPKNYYDDNIIIYSLLKYGKLLYIPDVMVNYRQLENSSWNSVDDMEKNLINLLDWDIEEQINSEYRRQSTIRHMYNILYVWLKQKYITPELREKYGSQMRESGLERAEKWMNFSKQTLGFRIKKTVWLFACMMIFLWNKVRKQFAMKKYF